MTNAEATTTAETAAVADQGAQTASKATSKMMTSKPANKESKKASKRAAKPAAKPAPAKKDAKPASKKASKAAATDAVPREFSKKAIVLDLLRRKDGATMAEIAKATDWQNHSIRGFISGNLSKTMRLTVQSTKNDAGERTYKIAK